MKRICIVFGMRRELPDGATETAEDCATLLMSKYFAERLLTGKTSNLVSTTLENIAMLRGFFFDGIKQVEEVRG